jgi:hypothetical protein
MELHSQGASLLNNHGDVGGSYPRSDKISA